jgi:SAM-dependent methyltransferase
MLRSAVGRDDAGMTQTPTPVTTPDRGDALAGRLFSAGLGALELLTVELGSRLGLYRLIRDRGWVRAGELANAAAIDERYAREWLEQQAVAALLDVDDPTASAHERRYGLPVEHDDVLLDPASLRFLAPVPGFVISFAGLLGELVDAFHTGAGISYERYGAAMRDSQGAFNRPVFARVLTTDWIPHVLGDLHRQLSAGGVRVADLGCGLGWSSIALGEAYPGVQIDGVDNDKASIEQAARNATAAGVADRVAFHCHDAAGPLPDDSYAAVFVFEALHDMPQPVAALEAARRMLADGGVCVVMDEKVADEFTAPGDEVERFMFAASVLHCLPVGLAEQPSAGTGTMLRRPVIERYAAEAGFSSITDLGVEHDFFRLYRLQP